MLKQSTHWFYICHFSGTQHSTTPGKSWETGNFLRQHHLGIPQYHHKHVTKVCTLMIHTGMLYRHCSLKWLNRTNSSIKPSKTTLSRDTAFLQDYICAKRRRISAYAHTAMATHRMPCEDSDKTERIRWLFWVYWAYKRPWRKCFAGAHFHGSKFIPFSPNPFSQVSWCIGKQTGNNKSCRPCKMTEIYKVYEVPLTLVLLNRDMPCLCKQCSSRSVGFFRSQLIWICTVCHSIWIKNLD